MNYKRCWWGGVKRLGTMPFLLVWRSGLTPYMENKDASACARCRRCKQRRRALLFFIIYLRGPTPETAALLSLEQV